MYTLNDIKSIYDVEYGLHFTRLGLDAYIRKNFIKVFNANGRLLGYERA